MVQKIFGYIAYIFSLLLMFYLIFFIWWLFLPLFIVLLILGAWRTYRIRKMWNTLLKQAQTGKVHKHYRKIDDDNVIDVEYEEIKS